VLSFDNGHCCHVLTLHFIYRPDGRLYIGNTKGQLGKITLNDNFDAVVSSVISTIVSADRGIHGIAFDPLESADVQNPTIYVSTSDIFHGESRSSFGLAINGKIQTVKGANLDKVTDIVTGLPVSELDHAVNGIYFGNNGELYIGVGSNTNGGIPGELSGSRIMKDNFFSAAILVANLGEPGFNGFITYNAPIDGDPITGTGPKGVEVFSPGHRNPFGVVVHSNGQIYATDNGALFAAEIASCDASI
jgi:glucose/arabinose dehydrogenase